MQRIRGAALLPAAVCLLAAAARADLNDGRPCFTYINPPGNGLRYACTSTSSHTVEHPEPVEVSKAWRTRVTARRQGEDPIYDLTIDSLSAPPDTPLVKAALEDAVRFVAEPGWAVEEPTVLSSSTAIVGTTALSVESVETLSVTPITLSSGAASHSVCVGSLGVVSRAPPPLPDAPCAPGATAVTLRPRDTSVATPLDDRLEDTNTATETDVYTRLTVAGEFTTTHYEVVARAEPCTTTYAPHTIFGPYFSLSCRSTSHHTVALSSTAPVGSDAWSTRITARLSGGTPLFDVTINSTTPPDVDDEIRRTLMDAQRAARQAAGSGSAVNGPALVSSSSRQVMDTLLPDAARLVPLSSTFDLPTSTMLCVGDFGDLVDPPTSLPAPPCGAGLTTIQTPPQMPFTLFYVRNTNTHTRRDVYTGLYVTGTLATTHYEYVGETSSSASTLTIPIVLSPTGGSAFTSELTLANLVPADVQATFTYTPGFGGTAGTVTDTLSGATQRVIPDAIAYLKGLGLSDLGAGGTLRMTFEGSAAPDVYAAVRTTAAVPEGRVGLAYPALPPSKLFSSSVFLCALRQNALDRSNVAVLNAGSPADGDVTLRLTVTSGDPANPQSKVLPDVTLPPSGFSQISGVLVSNGLALSNGTVRVDRISGTAPFYAYAVVNDQATNDGSFVEPVAANPASPIPSTTLPVLVETSSYSTELVLTNVSATNRTLNLIWVAPALSGGKATFSIALLPGEQQILPGFVQLLRDRGVVTDARGPSFAGALFVSDSTGDLRGVSISARILSALGGGRAGVALPSHPSGSESTAPVWLCGLQQNADTRSNLALVNVGSVDASPSDFRIDLYDGTSGVKVGSPIATVPAMGFAQIDRILATYAPGVTQGCALVTRISGANPFLAYAVLNDGAQPGQRSGDGAYVASVPLAP